MVLLIDYSHTPSFSIDAIQIINRPSAMLGTLTSVLSFHLNYLMKPILQSHLTEEKSKAHRSKNGASTLVIHQPTATHSVFGTLAHWC